MVMYSTSDQILSIFSKYKQTLIFSRSCVSFYFFQLSCVSEARKDPGEYWKSMMNDEAIPKAIGDLMDQNRASNSEKWDHFVRNFETKPNVIIYHSHHHVHSTQSEAETLEG